MYINPLDSDAIMEAMLQVLDQEKADALGLRAKAHINQSPFNLHKSLGILNNILVKAIPLRRMWGH